MSKYSVFLRGVTWIRDSHGLFDYESKSITKKSFKTSHQSIIARIGDDIEMFPIDKSGIEAKENPQVLLQIKRLQSKCLYKLTLVRWLERYKTF
jgi:hypothetical protein